MRVIAAQGHERKISRISFNNDSDLFLSSGFDTYVSLWRSHNGERIGTYDEGHNGAILTHDLTTDSVRLATGSGDFSAALWDTETGKVLNKLTFACRAVAVAFSNTGNELFVATDNAMKSKPSIALYDIRTIAQVGDIDKHIWRTELPDSLSVIRTGIFGPASQTIITGHDSGEVVQFDAKTGKQLNQVRRHKNRITDLKLHPDETMLISSSKDCSANVYGAFELDHFKEFTDSRPCNSAAFSPDKDYVVLAGGQEARDVTTSSAKQGKFESKFFHLIHGDEFARVKGHFGPVNSVAFSRDGTYLATGGEDGIIKINHLDINLDILNEE